MEPSLRLLLARHGLTDWNLESRLQGQTDTELCELGRRQASALAHRLQGEELHAIYASDLQRAWQTAQAITTYHQAPLIPEPALREIHFGEWEGLTYAEVEERDPQALAAWQADLEAVTSLTATAVTEAGAPPGGESLAQLAARVEPFLENLKSSRPGQTVLLVAHGGPLQVLLCLALGLPAGRYWQFHLAPAALAEVRLYPLGAVLNQLNDTCHLDGLEAN